MGRVDAVNEARPARIPRGPARFTEADVRRAIRGAQKAKIAIAAVEIAPNGCIRVIPGIPTPVAASATNPLDDL
jgi:hypothetical protein